MPRFNIVPPRWGLSTCFVVACLLSAQADVIRGTHVLFQNEPSEYISAYRFTLYQDEAATDPTSFWLNFDGATLSFASIHLDEGSGWYHAHSNEAFSAQTIAADVHPVLFSWHADPTHNDLPIAPGPFYLGIQTWHGTNAVYGWALMDHTGSELVLLDNAMAYGAEGIYVGTTAAIPEPATLVLLAAGGLVLYGTRRARRR